MREPVHAELSQVLDFTCAGRDGLWCVRFLELASRCPSKNFRYESRLAGRIASNPKGHYGLDSQTAKRPTTPSYWKTSGCSPRPLPVPASAVRIGHSAGLAYKSG